MIRMALFVCVGAVIGALLGHASQCSGGGWGMFASWKRGLVIGAIIGLVSPLQKPNP